MEGFDEVWQRIAVLQGQTFYQKTGKPFTYKVSGNSLRPETTNRQLPRSQFARAFERAPLIGPGQLQDLQGPSYLFAILTDPRVTGGEPGVPASRPVTSGRTDGGRPGQGSPPPEREIRAPLNTPNPLGLLGPGALRLLDFRRALLVTACSAAKVQGGRPITSAQPGWPGALLDARARVLASAGSDASGGLLPAWQRYTGTFYRYAAPVLGEAVAAGNLVIISGGYGLVRADEPIAWYNKVLRLADWPKGLLESMLVSEARRANLNTVVAFVSGTTSYAQLIRRTRWQAAGLNAYLVTVTGVTDGAMFEVPRQLGLAFCAFWKKQDDHFPPDVTVERLT